MHCLIAGGTGLIGQRLVKFWLKKGYTITVIGRSRARIEKCFGNTVQSMTWDKLTLDEVKLSQVIVNLTGESVGGKRWTPAKKKEMLNSRVGSTKMLAAHLATLGQSAPPLLNASGIGIYGPQSSVNGELPQAMTEATPIDTSPSASFLAKLSIAWEAAAEPAIRAGVRVCFLRFAVVLAKEGGALPEWMKPFRYYLGGSIGGGQQAVSWVAIDDVIRVIDFLAERQDATGPFNVVAPHCVKQMELAALLAKFMSKPDIVPLPAFIVKLIFGEMGRALLLDGQHVAPTRLLAMGFEFTYAELESALHHELG